MQSSSSVALVAGNMNINNDDGQERRKHRKILPTSSCQSQKEEEEQQQQQQETVGQASPETFARNYQLEAVEKALKENTIAFLDTGSGKTLIAIMLLRNYADMLRKPSQFIAVFLVPTVILVDQQAQVVKMHTDLKVGKFYGEMGVDFWNAATWNKYLKEYEVFVMTPQVLLDNLRHSFFNLENIKLLMFDECHHARGKSPYASIMTEFYHHQLRSNSTRLPRIFGMTASLINSKGLSSRVKYRKQILELESLMNSKVYTVANESVLAEFIPFSTTKLKIYNHVEMPYGLFWDLVKNLTILTTKHLRALQDLQLNDCANERARRKIKNLSATFQFCLTELGIWLTLKAAESLSCNDSDIFSWWEMKDQISDKTLRNFSLDVCQVFSQYIPSDWCIGDDLGADIDAGFLTAKVDCLIQSLLAYRGLKDLRCIIFVERIITAIVLQQLLSQVRKLSGWKITHMTGSRQGLQSQTRKEHISIVDAFREGDVNIIVATQILEEGLDVQSCKLVIRFDLSPTVCSFIQSRGRARMQGSDYLLIVKSGDSCTFSKIQNYHSSGDVMREESLRQASLPCAPLKSEMCDEMSYRVETTGAIATLRSSVALIHFYCSQLPSDRYFSPSPRFVMDKESNFCTLHLPKNCPIQTVCAQGQNGMLKQIVCLEACKKLHEIGALTDQLLPKFDVEEVATTQESGYHSDEDEAVNYFPEELIGSWPSYSEKEFYHCYIITFNKNFDYNIPFRNIAVIVKCNIGSDFANTGFNLEVDRGSVNVNMEYSGTIHLSSGQVLLARRFQITILRILIDHKLNKLKDSIDGLYQEGSLGRITYLLLPSICCKQNSSIIDWDCVSSALYSSNFLCSVNCGGAKKVHCCCAKGDIRLMRTKEGVECSCMLRNSLVVTPHNGCIYCITDILDDLDGNSIMKTRGPEVISYRDYYQSRHSVTLNHEKESLLVGRHLFTVQNWFMRRSFQKEKESSNAYVELPPELCVIIMSPISISTFYSFSLVPSIIHRIESMLLAVGLKKLQSDHCTQNVNIPAIKVLEAITTKKCQEEFSLESLETLGDSFLKYAASQQLFRANKHDHEGLLTAKRESMISNKALCKLGCDRKLTGFIRNECFDPKQWIVPGDNSKRFQVDEMLVSTSVIIYSKGTRHMKYKVIADVVEALIGTYLSTGGEVAALLFMDWLGMKIDFFKEIPCEIPFLASPEKYVNINHLESLLKYPFHDPSLLVKALTHASYQVSDIPGCYQRLEFLGDSVLDYLITIHMYNRFPGVSPGLLTDLRSASVNNDRYALAAVKAELNKYILHASSELHRKITCVIEKREQLLSSSSFGWDAEITLPKVLGDVVESLAGAIFVDSGFNKDIVWKSIKPLLEPMVTPESLRNEPVRELNELQQKKKYVVTWSKSHSNGMFSIAVEVEADGKLYTETRTGSKKETAKRLAARAVLDAIEKDKHSGAQPA